MPVRESAIPNEEFYEMRGYSRVSTVVVAIAAAFLASTCTAGVVNPSPTSRSSPVPTATPSTPPTATLGATPRPIPSGQQNLEAGTYAFDFPLLDAPGKPFPKVVITVPDGWSNSDFAVFGLVDTPRALVVSFWDVVDVYADPCHWHGPMIHPGPTVDGLATVLADRPLRNATKPVAVSLGGYSGKYLEWSVPADIVFSDCDMDADVHYFESWTGYATGGGDRYQQAPGQVDRLWILDVEGRRLVIDANYRAASTDQDRAELQQVVDSIRFEP